MNYYNEIKNEIVDIETYKKVKDYSKNKRELEGYYKIGKLIVEAQGGELRAKYGDGLIKDFSKKLTEELGKGYTTTSLKRMRKFYSIIQKGATLSHQLSWSHYQEIIPLKNINQNNTIGIIVCKKDNEFIMHYCKNKNIYQTTYLTVNEEVREYISKQI